MTTNTADAAGAMPLPGALISRNPMRWLAVFGPGAVLASLTIGVGELVFSSRAGALFGYRLLWLFGLVLVLKWILVHGSARHMVLTGAHPFQRWMDLPGPRGWLPLTFFLLAIPCFPIWVCFHAGTLGTLTAALTGTSNALHGGAHLLWGCGFLAASFLLCARGGYKALETIQLWIVVVMLASVVVAILFMPTDWAAFLQGLFIPTVPSYPDWLAGSYPEVAKRPLWLEIVTYAGIIGGSSYDYLAYTSYLREKKWGHAGSDPVSAADLERLNPEDRRALLGWLRVPLIDCTLSFVAVLVFTAVFVIGGATVLGPQHQVPAGSNLLSLQAEFLAVLHPWFRIVYFAGAFLAVLGTLYGTIEVAPAILQEMARAMSRFPDRRNDNRDKIPGSNSQTPRLRWWTIVWVCAGGFAMLLWTLAYHLRSGSDQAPGLIAILTPANLFTGVLGCGIICIINGWMDWRFLPGPFRPSFAAIALSVVTGLVFLALGLVASWDHSRGLGLGILAGAVVLGMVAASVSKRFRS